MMLEDRPFSYSQVHSWQQMHDVHLLAQHIMKGTTVSTSVAYGVLSELARYANPLFDSFHDCLERFHPNVQAAIYRKTMRQEYSKYGAILKSAHPRLIRQEKKLLAQNKIHMINIGKKSRGTVLVFTTLFNNFYMTKIALVAMLVKSRYSVILVNDSSGYYYLNGINSNLNTWEKLVLELQRQVNGLNGDKLIITGFSSGGYAALLAALELNPDYFFIFSGVVDLEKKSDSPYPKLFRDREGHLTPSELRRNLALELSQRELNGSFFAGKDNPRDCAELLKVVPTDKVKTSIVADAGHICFREMVLDGSFEKLFYDLVKD